MLADGLAHGLTLLGVSQGLIQGASGETDGASGYRGASEVKGAHGDLEALAGGAEHVLGGHADVLEGDSTGVRAALTHVDLLLADGDTGRIAVDNEGSECLTSRDLRTLGTGENEVPVGDTTVGDPHLQLKCQCEII